MAKKRYPTKIMAPEYVRVFERERLFALVEQKKSAELVWVSGPPGAGKTVFAASLLKHRSDRCLWYRIDASENNFTDIFHFLALAAQKNYPDKQFKLPVFTAEYADNIENFARVFFRELFAVLTQETSIVLDNCQELEQDSKFFRLLYIAVDQLTHGLQLICISRNRPAMKLYRLLVTDRLLEIGDTELRFTDQESGEFIRWLDSTLSDNQVEHIQSKTLGWAAGIMLMTRQMAFSDESECSIADGASLDYLSMEMLPQLSRKQQQFLTTCALFSQFTAEMSAALTGNRKAKSDLDALVFKNFLIERTSGTHPVYRLHPLLRDLLLTNVHILFSESEWQALQREAAQGLIKQGNAVEALLIYQHMQNWAEFKAVLLQEAQNLINTGRHRTVLQWIKALPENELETDTWLSYWHAIALKPSDPLLAEEHLEICYQRFVAARDIKGIYSAWIAAVDSIAISWDDFSKLRRWMNRFDDIRKDYSSLSPLIELKIQFYATGLQAFSIFNIQHPLTQSLIRICKGIFRFIPVRIIKTALSLQLAQYYMFNLQLTKAQPLFVYLDQALEDNTLPITIRIMSAYLLVVKNLLMADTVKGIEYTNKGLELSTTSGVRIFEGMLLANSVGCHINGKDIISAESALQKAIALRNNQQRIPIVMQYANDVWLTVLAGNLQHALEKNKQALQLAELIHFEIAYVAFWSLEVQILAELSQWKKAKQTLILLSTAAQNINNKHNQVQYYLAVAWFAYLQQDEFQALSATKRLFQIMREENFFAFFGWRPKVFTLLCSLAIEHHTEYEFAIRLIKKHQLQTTLAHLEHWPWSVRIYSFGTLTVEVDGKSIHQSGKTQKKIFELLEAIILSGGRHVQCERLAEMLWPDADGDQAKQSIETALHRLRKLISRDAVILSAGLISLNPQQCWLDLWAFDATADELENILNTAEQKPMVVKLTDRLLKLYRDVFLKNTDSGAVALKREQLLDKLSRILDLSICFHDQLGEYERVYLLLTKALELRPLVEKNYRRLMLFYINQKQHDQAFQIYQQCQRILQEGFNIPLSDEIQSLARQIRHTR